MYNSQLTSRASQSAQNNRLNSPLLRLPAEIRNLIYACIFTGHEISVCRTFPGTNIPYFHYRPLYSNAVWSTHSFRFDLSLTCRQLYHETTQFQALFYSLNAFRGNGLDLRFFTVRAGSLRPLAKRVRTLHYDCPYILRNNQVPVDVDSHFRSLLDRLARLPGLSELVIIGPKRLHGHSPEFVLGLVKEWFGLARGGLSEVEIRLQLLPTSLTNFADD